MIKGNSEKTALGIAEYRHVFVALAAFLFFVIAHACSSPERVAPDDVKPVESNIQIQMEQATLDGDYSSFSHDVPTHQRLPCLLCHVREDNSPVPKLSGHLNCSGCHVQQFAQKDGQICAICHTDTQSGSLKRFPPLQNFDAKFDHSVHLRQTNCSTCHHPARKGFALSIPTGAAAHNACFQCHGPDKIVEGRNIGSFSTCHESGSPPKAKSEWARAFSYNFSHADHKGKQDLNCTSCHSVIAGRGGNREINSPVVAMHFATGRSRSCGGCHNDKRAFGIEEFTNCRRCHEGKNFKF
jgi:c(7)-type cytochrome triheme protein